MTTRLTFIACAFAVGCAITIAAQVPQPQPPQSQTPTFSTRAEFVRVDTLVTSRGNTIAGLKAADFELRDNGVPQQVTVIETASLPVDVVMALDVSDSMTGAPLASIQDAAQTVIESLREGDRVALVSFSDLLLVHARLTNDFVRVRQEILHLAASGFTSLRDAAYAAMFQGDPDSGRSLVMLFTDGQDMSSWLSEGAVVDAAKRVNAVIYSVTLKPAKNALRVAPQDEILDTLPALTGGRRLSAEQPARLREVFATIIREFRQRYILTYVPRGVDRAGYHALDVRLANGRKGEVRARPGYFRSS